MEVLFGRSLSDVKVHEDHRATLLGAQSYAQGTDIVFAPGQYNPGTERGQRLIAHELTHVTQQRQGATEVVEGMVEIPEAPVSSE